MRYRSGSPSSALSPRLPARPYGQAGGRARRLAAGAERLGKRRAGAARKVRWRTVSAAAAVRYEMCEPSRKLGAEIAEFETERR